MRRIVYYNASKPAFRPFIFTVDSGADARYTIPTFGTGYNYSINTSDGQFFNGVTGNKLIIFPLASTLYDIEIRGLFPAMKQFDYVNGLKTKDIVQFGDVMFSELRQTFLGAVNLTISATDYPKLINAPILSDYTFDTCNNFNYSINHWDVSKIYYAFAMFNQCWSYNQPMNNWDVGNLQTAFAMFQNCYVFNQDLSSWNTVSLQNPEYMFRACYKYNQNMNTWNFSSCTTLQQFLHECYEYDKPIDFSHPITGTVNVQDFRVAFRFTKSASIKLRCDSAVYFDQYSFENTFLTELELWNNPATFYIHTSPLLTGTAIDNLANSVRDMTGLASPSITMTLAQRASCNQALWTNKNWTIIAV